MEKFKMKLHGYNPKEVNAFLDDVIKQVDKMVSEIKNNQVTIANLQNEKNVLTEQINRYKAIELTMNRALSSAQDSGEQIRRIAKQESEMIIKEARNNANRIVSDSLIRAQKAEYEAAQLRKNVTVFKRKLRSVIESQLDMVDDIETLDI